jgi:hypothetical protein
VQLLAIILYGQEGQRRLIEFKVGELNIVTGMSSTGKSALLDIVEFCLGRTSVVLPVGPISSAVAWYAVLLQLPQGQAFVARPSPRPGLASTQRGMLEFGADLHAPDSSDLVVNADTDSIREQLGRRIGIAENRVRHSIPSLQPELEANLGHAALLCFQRQTEIATNNFLFHRQTEEGIGQAIQDTLPFFLGATAPDQAVKRRRLREARRDLRRLRQELERAESVNAQLDASLQGLLDEAYGAGIIDTRSPLGRDEALAVLGRASAPSSEVFDIAAQDEQRDRRLAELGSERDALRRSLQEISQERRLVAEEGTQEREYQRVLETQRSRLSSSLETPPSSDPQPDELVCPICLSRLSDPDPTVEQLRAAADRLRAAIGDELSVQPQREAALAELDEQAQQIRERLRGVVSALTELRRQDDELQADLTRAESQSFTRGRIDHYLSTIAAADDDTLHRLRLSVQQAESLVDQLTSELDAEDERERLTSILNVVGTDMTEMAGDLGLEHGGSNIRLDLSHLTVVTDTDSGPAPLLRIGSAANWMGYHVVTHLALHRHFVRNERPVPRFLMFDQPSSPYYPSELEEEAGVPQRDADREAVHRLFERLNAFVVEAGGAFQLVVCDHANLPEAWFQAAIRENWRGGAALIPPDWISI